VPEVERKANDAQADEMRRLKADLKRVTEERDILKKAAASSTGHRNSSVLMAYSRRIKCHELADLDYHRKRSQNFGIDGEMVNRAGRERVTCADSFGAERKNWAFGASPEATARQTATASCAR
jgi:hypothetical protein